MKQIILLICYSSFTLAMQQPPAHHSFSSLTDMLHKHGSYQYDPIDDGHSLDHAHHIQQPLIKRIQPATPWYKQLCLCLLCCEPEVIE